MSIAIELAERGLVPDTLKRLGIRKLLKQRIEKESLQAENFALNEAPAADAPLAVATEEANEQHYMVTPDFYQYALGKHLKYSSCWFNDYNSSDLDQAESAMLGISAERAQIVDGMDILELGCGWGSLTCYLAEHFPNSKITAVSNSSSQREHILTRLSPEQRERVTIITADLNNFAHDKHYDRIVSIECFEHLRNWRELFRRIAFWLKPGGKLFFHVFCHHKLAYRFEDEDQGDWMARHFFTGGHMPAYNSPMKLDEYLRVEEHWKVNGLHYAATSRCWLERIDAHKQEVITLFSKDLNKSEAHRQFQRWRLFFMACEECFGYKNGEEWLVGHYLMSPQ